MTYLEKRQQLEKDIEELTIEYHARFKHKLGDPIDLKQVAFARKIYELEVRLQILEIWRKYE